MMRILISLIGLSLIISSCTHQAPWSSDFEAGKAAVEAAQYRKAIVALQSGLSAAEQSGKPGSDFPEILYLLARAQEMDGKKKQAAATIARAVTAGERHWGKDSLKLVPLLKESFTINYSQKKLDQAEKVARQALAIQEKELGDDDAQLMDTLNQVIAAACAGTRCEDTRPLLEELLRLRIKHLGPEHPHVAVCLSLLGELAEKRGEYETALKYYEQALAIRRKKEPSLVPPTQKNILRAHQKMLGDRL